MSSGSSPTTLSSLAELRRIYRFTEDDLIANREGELSDAQRQRLRNRLFGQMFAAPLVGGGMAALSFLLLDGGSDTSGAIWLIPFGVLLAVMAVTFRALVALVWVNNGQVEEITGAASLTEGLNSQPAQAQTTGGGWAGVMIGAVLSMFLTGLLRSFTRTYTLRVGNTDFRISRAAYRLFTPGVIYKIYTLGTNRQIIAVENLTR